MSWMPYSGDAAVYESSVRSWTLYKVDPRLRIYALCAILGLIGWPGIARMVPRTDPLPAGAGVHDRDRGDRCARFQKNFPPI